MHRKCYPLLASDFGKNTPDFAPKVTCYATRIAARCVSDFHPITPCGSDLKVFLELTVTLTTSPAFLQQHPDPVLLTHTAEKLRWYRLKNGLLQWEVADHIGIDRSTYIHYESKSYNLYPPESLKSLADLFGISVTMLLDGYNRFLFNGQGKQIKALRVGMNLTQIQLARLLYTTRKTVKEWESDRVTISKIMWKKLNRLNNST